MVTKQKDRKTVEVKFVYELKQDENGCVSRFKSRLVAKGYTQKAYEETFSPVVKSRILKVLLSLANSSGWQIDQMDVKTTFLNGDIDVELYVDQPEGFVDPRYKNHVYPLKKSLYGLKQSPRTWNTTINTFLLSLRFDSTYPTHCGSMSLYITTKRIYSLSFNFC